MFIFRKTMQGVLTSDRYCEYKLKLTTNNKPIVVCTLQLIISVNFRAVCLLSNHQQQITGEFSARQCYNEYEFYT